LNLFSDAHFQNDFMKKPLLLAFIFLLVLLSASVALAQGSDPNNPHNLSPQQLQTAKDIQQELWCPVCQGVRLDACEQKVCQQMRDMIDKMLLEGKSKQEIIDEFVVQYGVVILGEPPKQGFNLMAWLMPVILVLAGLALAFWLSRSWMKKSRTAAAVSAAAVPSAETKTETEMTEDDAYLARVEHDLAQED